MPPERPFRTRVKIYWQTHGKFFILETMFFRYPSVLNDRSRPAIYANNSEEETVSASMPSIARVVIKRLKISLQRWTLLICLAGMAVGPPTALGEETREVRLAAFNYPPFYWEENGAVRGLGVDLLREVFGRMHIKTRLTLYPLKRALEYTRAGRSDGIMILIRTPEREAYLDYTDPVMTVKGLIWSRVGRAGGAVDFERLEDLREYKVGATLGYSYGPKFDAILKTMDVERVASDFLNFKKLLAGRIDIFPGNEIVAGWLFKRHEEFQGKFVHSDRSFIEWTLHMGVSRKSPLVLEIPRINRLLADIKADGFLEKRIRHYTE
jgi:polar amino acid transport system substrate-binding protein